jgi:hypothetical protein
MELRSRADAVRLVTGVELGEKDVIGEGKKRGVLEFQK